MRAGCPGLAADVWDDALLLTAPLRALLNQCCTLFPAAPRPLLRLLAALAGGRGGAAEAYAYLAREPALTVLHEQVCGGHACFRLGLQQLGFNHASDAECARAAFRRAAPQAERQCAHARARTCAVLRARGGYLPADRPSSPAAPPACHPPARLPGSTGHPICRAGV